MTEPADDQPRTIDEIVAALTSPARAEELQGGEALVDAMAAAVIANHPKEPAPMTSRSRPLKIGLLAGAAVLSLAGAAAAATGVLPDRKPAEPPIEVTTTVLDPSASTASLQDTTTTAESTTTTATTVDQSTTEPDTATTAATGAAPTVTAPPCPAGVKNHGEYVSGVARETPPGPDHGKIVSAAAQSDCGKGSDDGTDATVTTGDKDENEADDAAEVDDGSSGPHGSGHGANGAKGSGGDKGSNQDEGSNGKHGGDG